VTELHDAPDPVLVAEHSDPTDHTVLHAPLLSIGPSGLHGLGVFARRGFDPDDLVEEAPVILVHADDRHHLDETALAGHYFEWGEGHGAVALGFGSLYNHSYTPNARYWQDEERGVIEIVAIAPIAEGDEVLINYNGDPDSDEPLWFDTT